MKLFDWLRNTSKGTTTPPTSEQRAESVVNSAPAILQPEEITEGLRRVGTLEATPSDISEYRKQAGEAILKRAQERPADFSIPGFPNMAIVVVDYPKGLSRMQIEALLAAFVHKARHHYRPVEIRTLGTTVAEDLWCAFLIFCQPNLLDKGFGEDLARMWGKESLGLIARVVAQQLLLEKAQQSLANWDAPSQSSDTTVPLPETLRKMLTSRRQGGAKSLAVKIVTCDFPEDFSPEQMRDVLTAFAKTAIRHYGSQGLEHGGTSIVPGVCCAFTFFSLPNPVGPEMNETLWKMWRATAWGKPS